MGIGQLPNRGRAVILWGIVFFLAAQFGLAVAIKRWPEWSDPEYGYRLRHLRRGMKKEPDRPLLVVLGSSRIGNGVEADCLPPASCMGDQAPIVFNMSMSGGDPTYELLILKRLLALGIHPRWVVVEVLPPSLNCEDMRLAGKDYPLAPNRLRWSDLGVMDRYAPQYSWYRYGNWLQSNLLPWYSSRFAMLSRFAPSLLEPAKIRQVAAWRIILSPRGWIPFASRSVSPEHYQKYFRKAYDDYSVLVANFRIDPKADRLFREILDTCRDNAISVIGLLRMPEATDFRKLYSPEATRMIDSYLKELGEEYGIESIDASAWLSDDCFADGHHLLLHGAERFTLRLWNEVLDRYLKSDPSTLALSQTAAPQRESISP
jgi:hypothetical protein